MNWVCRGIRGATTASANTKEAILQATTELLQEMVKANSISPQQIAAIFFTSTSDLNAAFPATAARQMWGNHLALLDAQEVQVPGDIDRCIRVLMLVNTDKRPDELVYVYLRGTEDLRERVK